MTRRLAFVYIPHIFAESEENRRAEQPSLPLVIVSGESHKSVVIDYSRSLEGSAVKRGAYARDLKPLGGDVEVLPADYERVGSLHRTLLGRLKQYSPWVESPRTGSYYVDLTGTRRLFGREIDTCGRIIRELWEAFGLRARSGIGSTTLVARMASLASGDCGAYEVCATAESLFLAPLPVELIPSLSSEVRKELRAGYNIRRVGELLPFSREELAGMFGREGDTLYRSARNIARNRLVEKKTEQVVEKELVVSSESNEDGMLRRQFFSMLVELCEQMREDRILPRAFSLTVVYQDGYRFTDGGRLENPSSFEKDLFGELLRSLDGALGRRACVKKILLSFSHLGPHAVQLRLFEDAQRGERLADAMDDVHRRFGKDALQYGG